MQALFSIEARFLEIHEKWAYGRFRFWIAGRPVGDFEDTSDLATSVAGDEQRASARRTRPDLEAISADAVFEILYGRHVEPVHTTQPRPWSGPWDCDPYVLDDVGESALRDKYAVVVVRRRDGSDRMLVKTFATDALTEHLAPPGVCDDVIAAYCSWVEALFAKHRAIDEVPR